MDFIHRNTFQVVKSVHSPDYIGKPEWVPINRKVEGGIVEMAMPECPQKYWEWDGDVVIEMTDEEKQAVDAAEANAAFNARTGDQILDSVFASFTVPADQVQVVRALTAGFQAALNRRQFGLCRVLLAQAVTDGDLTQTQADTIDGCMPT